MNNFIKYQIIQRLRNGEILGSFTFAVSTIFSFAFSLKFTHSTFDSILWNALFVSLVRGSRDIFEDDFKDGFLIFFSHKGSLRKVIGLKVFSHWLSNGLLISLFFAGVLIFLSKNNWQNCILMILLSALGDSICCFCGILSLGGGASSAAGSAASITLLLPSLMCGVLLSLGTLSFIQILFIIICVFLFCFSIVFISETSLRSSMEDH